MILEGGWPRDHERSISLNFAQEGLSELLVLMRPCAQDGRRLVVILSSIKGAMLLSGALGVTDDGGGQSEVFFRPALMGRDGSARDMAKMPSRREAARLGADTRTTEIYTLSPRMVRGQLSLRVTGCEDDGSVIEYAEGCGRSGPVQMDMGYSGAHPQSGSLAKNMEESTAADRAAGLYRPLSGQPTLMVKGIISETMLKDLDTMSRKELEMEHRRFEMDKIPLRSGTQTLPETYAASNPLVSNEVLLKAVKTQHPCMDRRSDIAMNEDRTAPVIVADSAVGASGARSSVRCKPHDDSGMMRLQIVRRVDSSGKEVVRLPRGSGGAGTKVEFIYPDQLTDDGTITHRAKYAAWAKEYNDADSTTLNSHNGQTEKVRVWTQRPVMCSHGHACGGWTGKSIAWTSHVLGQGGTKRKAATVDDDENEDEDDEDEDDDEGWDIEKIIKKGKTAGGTVVYRVRWLGYSASADTWQTADDLEGARESMDLFESKLSKKAVLALVPEGEL